MDSTAQPERFRHIGFVTATEPGPAAPALSPAVAWAEGRLARAPRAPDAPDDETRAFLAFVFDSAALDLTQYRIGPLARRVPACLRALCSRSPAEACAILARDPSRLDAVLDALLLGVSSFFRDPAVFAELRGRIIPELLRARPEMRILSIGCSDGAEIYSVAMILEDLGALGAARLTGIDFRMSALARARGGRYLLRNDTAPPPGTERHSACDSKEIRVLPSIRRTVEFRRADVLRDFPMGPFELVLCRNLAMYLTEEAAARLWTRLAEAVVPGGYVVTGRAEQTPIPGMARVAPSLFQRTDARGSHAA